MSPAPKNTDAGSFQERDGAQETNNSSEIFDDVISVKVTKPFISSNAYTRAQQLWEADRQLRAEATILAAQTSTQLNAEFRMMEYDTSAAKGRVQQNPNAGLRNPD